MLDATPAPGPATPDDAGAAVSAPGTPVPVGARAVRGPAAVAGVCVRTVGVLAAGNLAVALVALLVTGELTTEGLAGLVYIGGLALLIAAALTAVVGWPAGLLVAWAMRGRRREVEHVLAFAAAGAVLSPVLVSIGAPSLGGSAGLLAVAVLEGAVGAGGGRWWAGRARRRLAARYGAAIAPGGPLPTADAAPGTPPAPGVVGEDDGVTDAADVTTASSTTVLRGRVVTPGRVLDDGVVVVEGAGVAWVGPSGQTPQGWAVPDESVGTILPGLVDVHCHGGGGASFPDATDAATARRAADEHLRHGTTSLVASLVTAPRDVLLARTALLADLADAGEIVGIHLEGPFLSADRCGAQNPGDMQPGDAALVTAAAAAARGHLVTMTVAPEVDGVADGSGPADARADVLAALVDAGALPSVGHTDASAAQVDVAVDRAFDLLAASPRARAGRLTATHLFNGMRPVHHRDPGPVAACLAAAARGELVVELVADGTHLADDTVRAVLDLVGPGSVAFVTDAMAAAGMPDGDYRLGPMAVRVADGVARVVADDGSTPAGGGAIAGGVAHLLDVVRNVVAAGVPLEDAVLAAATTPADVLGRRDLGALVAGRRADLVVTGDDLAPRRVMRAGAWVA